MTTTPYPAHATVVEVGMRDGLQSEPDVVPLANKLALARSLINAGIRHFEISSFVSPRAVPQLADAAELISALADERQGLELSALVPNSRGAIRAAEAGVDTMVVFVSASESHNQKNVNRSVADSLAGFREVCRIAGEHGTPVAGAIATAFGCPFQGEVPVARVVDIARGFRDLGMTVLTLGDTTGMATPLLVRERVTALREAVPEMPISLHFHNTRGIAMANVLAGLALGVDRFESAIGGLGGCPFAPGATGNAATEDMVYLLAECGVDTGIDLERLIQASRLAGRTVGHELPAQVSKAGPRLTRHAMDAVCTAAG